MHITINKALAKGLFEANLAAGRRFLNMTQAKFPENAAVKEASEKDLAKIQEILTLIGQTKGQHIIITDEEKNFTK